jgi:hypothetical protein
LSRRDVVGIRVREQPAERRVVDLAEQEHRVDLVGELGEEHRLLGLEHEPHSLAAVAARDDHGAAFETVACRP